MKHDDVDNDDDDDGDEDERSPTAHSEVPPSCRGCSFGFLSSFFFSGSFGEVR